MYNFLNTATIYVDQINGDDMNNNGFTPNSDEFGNGPLKTLEAALERIRDIRVGGIGYPISLKLVNDYYLDHTIKFNSESERKRIGKSYELGSITLESYGDRKRIIGGIKVTGWTKDTFNNVDCFSASVDKTLAFTDLYVNGDHAHRTVFPKDRTFKAVYADGQDLETERNYNSKWVIVNKDDINDIDGIEDAIISYRHCWIDEHSPIESYDKETGKLTFKYYSRFKITTSYEPPIATDLHYVLENLPCAFSNPGEWYFDKSVGKVYYIPKSKEETCDNIEAFIPLVKHFFTFSGTSEHPISNIRLKNLGFICTKGDYSSKSMSYNEELNGEIIDTASDVQSMCDAHGALIFSYAANCSIENCDIRCTGVHAIELKSGCHGIRIENNVIENIGAGGIKINGGNADDDASLYTYGNTIRGNTIKNLGLRYDAGCGILIQHSFENEISENEIAYLGYSGISVGWVWGYKPSISHDNIIRNNHIHHVGVGKLSDMGAIYTLGKQPGTIIEDNIIHDVTSAHYGGWGIYPDEGSSFINIENNIVYNTKCEPFHMHYGMYNSVRNNIFAYGGCALARISWHENHPSAVFEDNTFISKSTPVYSSATECRRSPAPGMFTSNNRYFDVDGEPVMAVISDRNISFNEWVDRFGQDPGSEISDTRRSDPRIDIIEDNQE